MIEKFNRNALGLSDYALIDKLNELIDAFNKHVEPESEVETITCPVCGSSTIFLGPIATTLIFNGPNTTTQRCTCNNCGKVFNITKRG